MRLRVVVLGVIRAAPVILEQIRHHGAEAYPHECCGAMLGRQAQECRTVTELRRLDNARTDSARNRFLITDHDYLRVERDAAESGLDLLGFYHSHPDHPARPSQHDLEHAFPWFSYVIVSVAAGRPGEMTSWLLSEDRARFDEESIREDHEAAAPAAGDTGAGGC